MIDIGIHMHRLRDTGTLRKLGPNQARRIGGAAPISLRTIETTESIEVVFQGIDALTGDRHCTSPNWVGEFVTITRIHGTYQYLTRPTDPATGDKIT